MKQVTERWLIVNVVHLFWSLDTEVFLIHRNSAADPDRFVVTIKSENFEAAHMSCVKSVLKHFGNIASKVLTLREVVPKRCLNDFLLADFFDERIKQLLADLNLVLEDCLASTETLIQLHRRLLCKEILACLQFFNLVKTSNRTGILEFARQSLFLLEGNEYEKRLLLDYMALLASRTVQILDGAKYPSILELISKSIPEWGCVLDLQAEMEALKVKHQISGCLVTEKDDDSVLLNPFSFSNIPHLAIAQSKSILSAYTSDTHIFQLLDLVSRILFLGQSDFANQFIWETDAELLFPKPREHEVARSFRRAIQDSPVLMKRELPLLDMFTVSLSNGGTRGWASLRLRLLNIPRDTQFVITPEVLKLLRKVSMHMSKLVLLQYRLNRVYRESRKVKAANAQSVVLWQMFNFVQRLVHEAHETVACNFLRPFRSEATTNIESVTQLRGLVLTVSEKTEHSLDALLINSKDAISIVEKYVVAAVRTPVDHTMIRYLTKLGQSLNTELSQGKHHPDDLVIMAN